MKTARDPDERGGARVKRKGKSDWAARSRARLDTLLVVAGVSLVVLGVVMGAHEYGHEVQNAQALRVFGSTIEQDHAYRDAYVPALGVLVLLVGGGTTWRFLRVPRSPRLARHGKRPLGLLVAGCALLDVAFFMDVAFGLAAPHATRALVVTPLYVLAGVLVTGAAWRMRTLIRPLPPGDPDSS